MESISQINLWMPLIILSLGGIGWLIQQNITSKRELLSEVAKERRIHYQKFVDLVFTLFSGIKNDNETGPEEMVSDIYEFYKKYVVYASPKVIEAFSNYFQFLYAHPENAESDSKESFQKLGKIMLAMRSDLGLANKNLGANGEVLFKAILKDYSKWFNN